MEEMTKTTTKKTHTLSLSLSTPHNVITIELDDDFDDDENDDEGTHVVVVLKDDDDVVHVRDDVWTLDSKSGCESLPERAASYCDDDDDDDDENNNNNNNNEEAGRKEEEEEESSSSAFDFKTCPQSFVRERIYLENLRRVERHNEALERGWPTETKLELSADNPFAGFNDEGIRNVDGRNRDEETRIARRGAASSREKNEDEKNVVSLRS